MDAKARSGALAGRVGGRPAALVEAAFLLLVILVFARLHAMVGKDTVAATDNAATLQSVERVLHVDIALAANRWLTEHPAFIQPAVYYYRAYYAVILGVLLWTWIRHGDVYVKVRRVLVALTILVLPVYWAVPMSPPRFALPGVVDIVAAHDIFGAHTSQEIPSGQNLTAMPSMHVGWSLWCAYAVWYALRGSHPRLALLAWIFPLGMTAVVFTTGNHYVLDVAGSVVLFAAAIAAATAWDRLTERRHEARSEAQSTPHDA
ncbi:phosphatase PAP2 family protein [Streptosporangiaceae bacterium NEAU-GS5]|nr:phosphatase PAP2 family protein [Streptosporangiaceae bacterium NEAU-GS5]